MAVERSLAFFEQLDLPGKRGEIADKIVKEISDRLRFLVNVGLNYLTLDRSAETLSGGEAQRIRLASQIGAGLVGVMYVLDEPSHRPAPARQRAPARDAAPPARPRQHGDRGRARRGRDPQRRPRRRHRPGRRRARRPDRRRRARPTTSAQHRGSLTGDYLAGREAIEIPAGRRPVDRKHLLTIDGAQRQQPETGRRSRSPVGLFTCVTGVSGSGKSTLVNDTLYPLARQRTERRQPQPCAAHKRSTGLEHFDKVIDIDQSPIGRTPRSNPATYTGLFTPIRELFAGVPEARARGYSPGASASTSRAGAARPARATA